jgi:NitT/TauT family transport system substrate-binding protein
MRLLRLLAFALFLFAVAACQPAAAPPEEDEGPLRIALDKWVGYAPLVIAEERGLFEQYGVEVELVITANNEETRQLLITKQVDLATAVTFDPVAQAAAGLPIQIVWLFDTSSGGDVVVGNRDVQTPADLRGKRIGLRYGSFSHAFIQSALTHYDIDESEVQFVNLSEDQIPAALASGQIDAGHTWEPYLSDAVANGGRIVFTSADVPSVIMDCLAMQAEVGEARAYDVQAVINAVAEAAAWWQANPEAGNQIASERFELSAEDVSAIVSGLTLYDAQDNLTLLAGTGEQTAAAFIAPVITAFAESGVIQGVPDFADVFNKDFITTLGAQAGG